MIQTPFITKDIFKYLSKANKHPTNMAIPIYHLKSTKQIQMEAAQRNYFVQPSTSKSNDEITNNGEDSNNTVCEVQEVGQNQQQQQITKVGPQHTQAASNINENLLGKL